MTLLVIVNFLSYFFHCFDKVYARSNLRIVFMLLLEYSTWWQVPGMCDNQSQRIWNQESESSDS